MKQKNEKSGFLDYSIGILMIVILALSTYLAPYAYSNFSDNRDMNEVHMVDREEFSFNAPVEENVGEKVQNMMSALQNTKGLTRTVFLSETELNSGELFQGIKEAIGIAISCKLLPDISAYDLEHNIIYAEYYNVSDAAQEGTEISFFCIRFSDNSTFDFTFRVDASDYIIYQAEVYCAEATEYLAQITSDDKEVVSYFNNQFTENADKYFEAEGYDVLTDETQSELVIMMGYERGEYALFHTTCQNGNIGTEGLRWGFVPMTVALEDGAATPEWGYKRITDYFYEKYQINVYENPEESQ